MVEKEVEKEDSRRSFSVIIESNRMIIRELRALDSRLNLVRRSLCGFCDMDKHDEAKDNVVKAPEAFYDRALLDACEMKSILFTLTRQLGVLEDYCEIPECASGAEESAESPSQTLSARRVRFDQGLR